MCSSPGWDQRLPFANSVWDILIVLAGSTTVLLFVYPPDLACYLRQGGERIVGSEDRKEED